MSKRHSVLNSIQTKKGTSISNIVTRSHRSSNSSSGAAIVLASSKATKVDGLADSSNRSPFDSSPSVNFKGKTFLVVVGEQGAGDG